MGEEIVRGQLSSGELFGGNCLEGKNLEGNCPREISWGKMPGGSYRRGELSLNPQCSNFD